MEFALQCARLIKDWEDASVLFASLGSDGNDGPTDAGGAIASPLTVEKGNRLGLDIEDYARRNDSYNYFKRIDDLIVTGPTRTNVMDFRFVLIG
jgi:hydroxypyruvate reductase